jgi:hypothetical protein
LGGEIYIARYVYMGWTSLATWDNIAFPVWDVMISCFSIAQRTCGANFDASKAELTPRVLVVVVSKWPSHSITIQFNKIKSFYVSKIPASPDTSPTGDA